MATSAKLIIHSALIHYTCIISQSCSVLFQPGNTGGGKCPFRRADSSLRGAVAACITFVYLPAKYNKSAIPTPHGSWSLRFYCHLAKIPTSQSGRPSKTCFFFRWQNRYSRNQAVEPKACKHISALNTSHANNLDTENRFFPMQAAWFCFL